MTNPLHEYEAWLDKLDKRFYLEGNQFIYNFDESFRIDLDECKEKVSIKKQARIVRDTAAKNEKHLPKKYLVKRFVRLTLLHSNLKISFDDLMQEINTEWGGYNEIIGDWEA